MLEGLFRSIQIRCHGRLCFDIVLLLKCQLDTLLLVAWKLTCINKGTKEKSWKYNSALSFNVSLFVFEKAYGLVNLSMIVNGVMMVFFSLFFRLRAREYLLRTEAQQVRRTVPFPR
jgi:hypothetical protein